MIKSKEEQERIMIACHASPEGKSSDLARIPEFQSGGFQHCTSIEYGLGGGGGGGGGGGITLTIDTGKKVSNTLVHMPYFSTNLRDSIFNTT